MKKWYQSKTIILNAVAAMIAILPEILSVIDVNFLTAIGVSNPMKYYTIIGFVTTSLNIFLRVQSAKPSAPIKTAARVSKRNKSMGILFLIIGMFSSCITVNKYYQGNTVPTRTAPDQVENINGYPFPLYPTIEGSATNLIGRSSDVHIGCAVWHGGLPCPGYPDRDSIKIGGR